MRLMLTEILRKEEFTVACLKNSAQTLILSFLLRPLGDIFSVMIGSGPQIERPRFPKSNGEVHRRPTVRGQAAVGIVATCEVNDMVVMRRIWSGQLRSNSIWGWNQDQN